MLLFQSVLDAKAKVKERSQQAPMRSKPRVRPLVVKLTTRTTNRKGFPRYLYSEITICPQSKTPVNRSASYLSPLLLHDEGRAPPGHQLRERLLEVLGDALKRQLNCLVLPGVQDVDQVPDFLQESQEPYLNRFTLPTSNSSRHGRCTRKEALGDYCLFWHRNGTDRFKRDDPELWHISCHIRSLLR